MEILYSDARIIVCIKPVGLDSEHDMPRQLQEQFGGEIFTLHRLDQNVGGVMVYARDRQTAGHFSKMIQDGLLVKEYIALVHGTPPEQGDWEDLLFKDSRKNKVFVVDRQRAGVKKARLAFQRLTEGAQSMVRIRLYTGRSHQIRVQFASRGYPLAGDRKYGARDSEKTPRLWSCCLRFPYKSQEYVFERLPQWEGIQ